MIPLLSAGELMSQSWHFFRAHWPALLKRTAWFILLFILYLIFGVPAVMREAWGAYAIILVLYVLGCVVTMNHISLYILKANSLSPSAYLSRRAIDVLAPVLAIAVLSTVILTLTSIAFVLPAIWLGVSFSFAYFLVLEDDVRAIDALKTSYRLVKGRWWATLWRLFAPTFVMAIAIWALSLFIWFVIGLVAGGSFFAFFSGANELTNAGAHVASGFAGILLLFILIPAGLVVQLGLLFVAVCYPLICRAKLFHALKQSAPLPLTK